jgi:uncharacterized protein YggL (DUF469 family)
VHLATAHARFTATLKDGTMKKRLRNKTHVGEFREWGVPIAVRRRHPDGFDDSLGRFIEEAVKAHGLAFGGGGHDDRLSGVVEVGEMTGPIETRLRHISLWLDARRFRAARDWTADGSVA